MSFRARLLDQLYTLPGCGERQQLARILGGALPVSLDDRATRIVGDLAIRHTSSIARNLPAMVYDNEFNMPFGMGAIWLEYSNEARFLTDGGPEFYGVHNMEAQRRMGCLIIRAPSDPGHIVVFVAWMDGGGNVAHSYALLHWRLEKFLAVSARPKLLTRLKRAMRLAGTGGLAGAGGLAGDGAGAPHSGPYGVETLASGLYGCAELTIPDGFWGEMEIMNNVPLDDKIAVARAGQFNQKISLAEHVFLLSTMLALESDRVEFSRTPDGGWLVSIIPSLPRRSADKQGFFATRGGLSFRDEAGVGAQ
jgi:hypothetical protein